MIISNSLKDNSSISIELHDAQLVGIYHRYNLLEVDVFFINQNIYEKILYLKGVLYFKCTDFENQNIVFECVVYDDYNEDTHQYINSYVKLMVTNSNNEILKNQLEIDNLIKLIVKKEKKLIVLIPSCGATIITIVDNFILENR